MHFLQYQGTWLENLKVEEVQENQIFLPSVSFPF